MVKTIISIIVRVTVCYCFGDEVYDGVVALWPLVLHFVLPRIKEWIYWLNAWLEKAKE